jgi:hypothetical protein
MYRRWRTGIWTLFMLLLGFGAFPIGAWANGSEGKIEGFADVPPLGVFGGSLTLPLSITDPPVTINVNLGIPTISVPVVITPATEIETEEGIPLPITLTDGDSVKVEFDIVGTQLVAEKLEQKDFPEVEVRCIVSGVPGGSLGLPLDAAASPVTVTCTLGASGVAFPITITSSTRVEGGGFTLVDGAEVEIEAIVLNGQVMATEIEPEN